MSVAARVFSGTSPGTLIAGLPHSRDRRWLHQLNETGSGECAVHVDDTIFSSFPAILGYGNIVRLQIDGTDRFAFIIEQRNVDPAPTTEKAGRYKRVSGRGVLAFLEDAIVYPEVGYVGSYARQRAFDYTSIAYNDSSWIAATQIQRVGPHDTPIAAWKNQPAGWNYTPDAYWIWSRAVTGSPETHPVGTSYFRKTFTTTSATQVLDIYATFDNSGRLWLDGEEIIDGTTEDVADYTQVKHTTRGNVPGTHILAAQVSNLQGPAGTENPGGLAVTVVDHAAFPDPSAYIVKTDSSWICLDYPASVPGMSLGEILRILITEAQTRGALTGLTDSFSDTLDSEGNAWAENPDIVFDIGTNYLDVIRVLVEQYVDVEMQPNMRLDVYNKGALGSNLTGSVNLQVGVHFEEATGAGEDHSSNVMLARDATGLLTQKTDASSLANRKRREAYLETALAPTEARAQAISGEVLEEFAQPSFQLGTKVIKGSGPYTTWRPGDTILMPNPEQIATAATVLSIAVEEDEAGHEIFNVEAVMLDATS